MWHGAICPFQPRCTVKTQRRSIIDYVTTARNGGKTVQRISVINLPELRGKIVMDPETEYLYWFDASRDRWCCVKDGIFSLYRMLAMMLLTHEHELPNLKDIEAVATNMHASLSVVTLANSDQQKGAILPAIRFAVYKLANIIDENKVRGRSQFHAMALWVDSKGRVNSGVLMCRNVTAQDHIRARIKSIRSMEPWLVFYMKKIGEIIRSMQETLQLCRNDLLTCSSHYRAMYEEEDLSNNPPTGKALKRNSGCRTRLCTKLEQIVASLQSMPQISPHSKATQLLLNDIEEVLSALRSRSETIRTHSLLEVCTEATAFRLQRAHIEGVLTDVRICMQVPNLWTQNRCRQMHQRVLRIKTACETIDPRLWQRPAAHERCIRSLAETLALLSTNVEPAEVYKVLKQAARI